MRLYLRTRNTTERGGAVYWRVAFGFAPFSLGLGVGSAVSSTVIVVRSFYNSARGIVALFFELHLFV